MSASATTSNDSFEESLGLSGIDISCASFTSDFYETETPFQDLNVDDMIENFYTPPASSAAEGEEEKEHMRAVIEEVSGFGAGDRKFRVYFGIETRDWRLINLAKYAETKSLFENVIWKSMKTQLRPAEDGSLLFRVGESRQKACIDAIRLVEKSDELVRLEFECSTNIILTKEGCFCESFWSEVTQEACNRSTEAVCKEVARTFQRTVAMLNRGKVVDILNSARPSKKGSHSVLLHGELLELLLPLPSQGLPEVRCQRDCATPLSKKRMREPSMELLPIIGGEPLKKRPHGESVSSLPSLQLSEYSLEEFPRIGD